MTASSVASIIVTAADLLALATCIGVLGFRIWVVSFQAEMPTTDALLLPLSRLIGICILILGLSSLGELIRRTVAMSGQPLADVARMLPMVLSKTHFGRVWLLRPVALLVLWLGWRARPNLRSPGIAAAMLAAACLVAVSRSLSGHAADWGDITLPEVMDCLHLLAVALWGGSMIGLTLTGFRSFSEGADDRRRIVAAMARRWSALAGTALAVVALTGIYNAWLELQRFDAFWQTAYGRVLLLKLSLVLIIVALGAANRYLGLPSLRAWASGSVGNDEPSGLPATARSVSCGLSRWKRHDPLQRFLRRARLEGLLMTGVLLCVAVLLSLTPVRHLNRMPAGHHMHAHGMAR